MDEFRVGQLTKELVAERLRRAEDPCAEAADVVRQSLAVVLRVLPAGGPAEDKVIAEAVRGGMQALILADEDVAVGGTLAAEALVELSVELGRDPARALGAALAGLAGLRRLLKAEDRAGLMTNIEARFPGCGKHFVELMAREPDPGARRRSLFSLRPRL